ncbi:hypothetical protein PJK55_12030 [Exiguobacterium sp. MMG028]|uniref:hypothetical protein n=1 Tax=Exiguobacterium sp. MMG028 TaxID=3021979 RepID=UPI0022FF1C21|nr:hypothetical protein [Exiguobacterium sp. MMG028]MDA5561470.1 hypothetical protein [Exiguobacterium sp. MMG028]
MNRNIVNFSILVLLMAVMVINNLEGMHTFKTIVNSLAILTLTIVGMMFMTNYVKNKKQVM